jgi:hypothetical protein
VDAASFGAGADGTIRPMIRPLATITLPDAPRGGRK